MGIHFQFIASALLGAIQMGIGTFTSALVSILSNNTALPMTGVMACCALTSFSILMMGTKIIYYRASAEKVEEETAEMINTL
jgi:DHA1 family bicyclomycin/chloramphenicol resistance-like MFS transporter